MYFVNKLSDGCEAQSWFICEDVRRAQAEGVSTIAAYSGRIPAGAVCVPGGVEHARSRFLIQGLAAPLVVYGGCGLGWLEPIPRRRRFASFYPEAY